MQYCGPILFYFIKLNNNDVSVGGSIIYKIKEIDKKFPILYNWYYYNLQLIYSEEVYLYTVRY